MLVLSRKENEEIVIGQNVSIRILGVVGNKVRLGISAPGFISIRRAELDLSATAGGNSRDLSAGRPAAAPCR